MDFKAHLKFLLENFSDRTIYFNDICEDLRKLCSKYKEELSKLSINDIIELDSYTVITEYLKLNFNKTIDENEINKRIEILGADSSLAYGYSDYLMELEEDEEESK